MILIEFAISKFAEESEAEIAKKKSALELIEEAKRGRELKPVDHSFIEYIPFRKNIYVVPKALAKLTEEEVKLKRDDLATKVGEAFAETGYLPDLLVTPVPAGKFELADTSFAVAAE